MEDNQAILTQLETHENLLANLLLGFTDLSVAVEALTERVLEPADEADRAEFRRNYEKSRNEMLKMLRAATQIQT